MKIDPDAPVSTKDDVTIKAPIATVWKLLTDMLAWPDWNPGIQSLELEAEVAIGTVFHWTASGLEITSTVGELVPEKRIVWSGLSQGIMAIHVWDLSESDEGVLVHTEESWEGKPVRGQIDLFQHALDRTIRTWLDCLKATAEGAETSSDAPASD